MTQQIQQFENSIQGLADKESSCIAFEGQISNGVFPRVPLISGAIDENDVHTIQVLKQWNTDLDKTQKKFNVRRRFLKTKDIDQNIFFDYVGQVVKILDSIGSNPCDVILTDYTSNPKINVPCSNFGINERFSPDSLLLVTFWDVNAAIAANLKEKQYVCLRNLRGKIVTKTGHLVAVMHSMEDQKENIKILPVSDQKVSEIKRCHYV